MNGLFCYIIIIVTMVKDMSCTLKSGVRCQSISCDHMHNMKIIICTYIKRLKSQRQRRYHYQIYTGTDPERRLSLNEDKKENWRREGKVETNDTWNTLTLPPHTHTHIHTRTQVHRKDVYLGRWPSWIWCEYHFMLQVKWLPNCQKFQEILCPGQGKVGKPFQVFGWNLVQGRRCAKWGTWEKWGEGKGGGKRAKNFVLYVIARFTGKASGNVESGGG